MRNRYLRQVTRRAYRAFVPDLSGGMNASADERVLPLGVAESSYNFSCESGALREGWGLKDAGLPPAARVWQFSRYDYSAGETQWILLLCDPDGQILYRREGETGFTRLPLTPFTTPPFAVGYRLYGEDVVIFCGETDRMAVWNGVSDPYSVPSSPYVTSLCMHYERMFVTTAGQKNAVWFSDDLDPTNWNPELDEGGFIELMDERGRLNRVLSFNRYVYVFRDYGITRLTAYADQSDFSVANLFVSSGRIYADTAVVCGDVILFLAEDGFYSFDGVSVRRILTGLDGYVCSGGAPAACFSRGKYWAAFRAADSVAAAGENDCLLSLDRHSGAADLMRGADVRALCPVADADGERLYAVLSDGRVGLAEKCGSLFGMPLKKVWRSGLIDLGRPDRLKLVREVFLDAATAVKLTIRADGKEKSFAVPGGKSVSRVRVNLSGSKIGVTLEAEGEKASVARLSVVYSLTG